MGNVTLRTGSVDFNLRTLSIPRQPRVTLRTGSVDFNCIRNNLSLNGKAVTLRMGSVDFNPHEAQVWWVQQNRPSCEERGF